MTTLPVKRDGANSLEVVGEKRIDSAPGHAHSVTTHPIMAAEQSLVNGEALQREVDTFYKAIKPVVMFELKNAAEIGRHGGLESSRLHMDLLLGKDEEISTGDYLRQEQEQMVDVPQRYLNYTLNQSK